MAFIFSGSSRTITLSPGTVVVDLRNLYSRYKDWLRTVPGAAGFLPAFKTVGGDIPAIPLFLFIINGWTIVPQSATHMLTFVGGSLETLDGSDPLTYPAGPWSIRVVYQKPGIAIGYQVSTGSGLSPLQDQLLTRMAKVLLNKMVTDPQLGRQIVFEDDGVTEALSADIFEDAAGTQKYRGQGAERREKLE